MEVLLNSVWALVAIAFVCLWFQPGRGRNADRRLSFIAVVMLIVILFPVISVSDDLWSIQNPAETDTCQRRDHRASCPHAIFPAIAAISEFAGVELSFGFQHFSLPVRAPQLALDNPALDPIQVRPPPSA
jgi:hypothetical protein